MKALKLKQSGLDVYKQTFECFDFSLLRFDTTMLFPKISCNNYFSFKKQTSMVNYIELGRKNSLGNKKQRRNYS